ncbi:MAG: rhomboid family intramembrane serine protease [Bacteroidetes bacterium]|nr:rhomboid family intramembrane serine protease [Bacteroidota bacterium]
MSLTIILILITSAISYWAFQNTEVQRKWLFHPYLIKHRNEWYRFISSGFVHAGWMHLIFNMFTFYFFGRAVEFGVLKPRFGEVEGGIYFILFYVVGIIISHISTYKKYSEAAYYRSLGASGGVSAVVLCSIMFYPQETLYIFGILPIPGFILGPLYLIYSYYQGRRGADNINHEAHLYGALFGILFSIVVDTRVIGHFIEQVSQYMAQYNL